MFTIHMIPPVNNETPKPEQNCDGTRDTQYLLKGYFQILPGFRKNGTYWRQGHR